jgi:hypothetical protein
MKTYLTIPILLAIILSGCGSVEPKPTANKVESKKISNQSPKAEKIKPQKDSTITISKSYPDWIMNSNRDGYVCNIGSSTLNGNLAITKKIANIEAKANISQDIKSYIKTQTELETNCRNQECKNKFSSKTNITSTQMIRNVETINQYTDTKKSIYYIHLCSKI